MYAIQNGSKFVKVQSFSYEADTVYNVSISDTVKLYKSKVAAETDLNRMNQWLDQQITHAEEVIEANTASIAKSKITIARLEEKLESLMDLPYREVERKVSLTRKAIEHARSDVRGASPSLRSYRQDLARYQKIRNAVSTVVLVQQNVEVCD